MSFARVSLSYLDQDDYDQRGRARAAMKTDE